MTITTRKPTPKPDVTSSYEHLIAAEIGLDAVRRNREFAQSAQGLGDPQLALTVGARAPLFTLDDIIGKPVALAEMIASGPTVLIFYRGGWCPFCNVHMRAFQLARTHIRALGASVLLISPELHTYAVPMLFPVLSDRGNAVARAYGLAFQMPSEMRADYREDGIDLAERNGDASGELPMPATFVVDRAGLIQYAFVSADYTQRAAPQDVIAVLRRLRGSR